MMQRSLLAVPLAVAVAALAACGETPQTGEGIRSDAPLHAGTGSNFMRGGWQPGDKASWEAQLKARQQYGQNEYPRTNAQ